MTCGNRAAAPAKSWAAAARGHPLGPDEAGRRDAQRRTQVTLMADRTASSRLRKTGRTVIGHLPVTRLARGDRGPGRRGGRRQRVLRLQSVRLRPARQRLLHAVPPHVGAVRALRPEPASGSRLQGLPPAHAHPALHHGPHRLHRGPGGGVGALARSRTKSAPSATSRVIPSGGGPIANVGRAPGSTSSPRIRSSTGCSASSATRRRSTSSRRSIRRARQSQCHVPTTVIQLGGHERPHHPLRGVPQLRGADRG